MAVLGIKVAGFLGAWNGRAGSSISCWSGITRQASLHHDQGTEDPVHPDLFTEHTKYISS
jgi:hypothetical protein